MYHVQDYSSTQTLPPFLYDFFPVHFVKLYLELTIAALSLVQLQISADFSFRSSSFYIAGLGPVIFVSSDQSFRLVRTDQP
jgi:hypothetical protein